MDSSTVGGILEGDGVLLVKSKLLIVYRIWFRNARFVTTHFSTELSQVSAQEWRSKVTLTEKKHEFPVFTGKIEHVHTVRTRSFLRLSKGLGTRLLFQANGR